LSDKSLKSDDTFVRKVMFVTRTSAVTEDLSCHSSRQSATEPSRYQGQLFVLHY
jgi:hypothetical protein